MRLKKLRAGILGLIALGSCGESDVGKASPLQAQEPIRNGYVQFMPKEQVDYFRKIMPTVADPEIDEFLHDRNTMLYTHRERRQLYQDSVDSQGRRANGIRANFVGYQTGIENGGLIGQLSKLFQDSGFRFPFDRTAGAHRTDNFGVITLWRPPVDGDGAVIPVRHWVDHVNRVRRRWTFPIGTHFGELLMMKDPGEKNGEWYPFEVRIRVRYDEGWDVDVFRPFPTAQSLADAIKARKAKWQEQTDLAALVSHLEDDSTLQKMRLVPNLNSMRTEAVTLEPASSAKAQYRNGSPKGNAFSPNYTDGGIDFIPEIADRDLLKEFLTTTVYQSAIGETWKANEALETYAPATHAEFSIVPKNYDAGLFQVNEEACSRCHRDAGKFLGNYIETLQGYGELWGEDQIFSWHPFAPTIRIDHTFGPDYAFDQRLIDAKLLAPWDSTNPEHYGKIHRAKGWIYADGSKVRYHR